MDSERVRHPRQRASRAKLNRPATTKATPVSWASGLATHNPSPARTRIRVPTSKRLSGMGMTSLPLLANQFRVKLGMIRPPTRLINKTNVARPSRCLLYTSDAADDLTRVDLG